MHIRPGGQRLVVPRWIASITRRKWMRVRRERARSARAARRPRWRRSISGAAHPRRAQARRPSDDGPPERRDVDAGPRPDAFVTRARRPADGSHAGTAPASTRSTSSPTVRRASAHPPPPPPARQPPPPPPACAPTSRPKQPENDDDQQGYRRHAAATISRAARSSRAARRWTVVGRCSAASLAAQRPRTAPQHADERSTRAAHAAAGGRGRTRRSARRRRARRAPRAEPGGRGVAGGTCARRRRAGRRAAARHPAARPGPVDLPGTDEARSGVSRRGGGCARAVELDSLRVAGWSVNTSRVQSCAPHRPLRKITIRGARGRARRRRGQQRRP